jgi:flagella basal body P-ring formation protein FlgA
MPGSGLSETAFRKGELEVTRGPYAEMRGLILAPDQPLQGLEARTTTLEGQPLLRSAVQKVPLVRRGEAIRLKVIAGGVSISTPAVAEEPGSLHDRIRVTSSKTKRTLLVELVGKGDAEVRF